MNCQTFLSNLDNYADNSLSSEQRQQMEAHAASCPACRQKLTLLQDLRTLSQQDAVPDGFAFAWRNRIRAEKRRIQPALQPLLSAAAVLIFLVGGTLWHRGQSHVGAGMAGAPMMRTMDASAFTMKAAEPTLWSRISDFFRDMGRFLLDVWPFLLAGALLVFLLLGLKKHLKK